MRRASYWEVPVVLAQLENAESAETVAMWREILWEPYALAPLDFLPDDASITSYQVHKPGDRKSTRLNSSHVAISYAVFCLKKKTLSSSDFKGDLLVGAGLATWCAPHRWRRAAVHETSCRFARSVA